MYSGMPSLQVECPMCRLPITYNLTQLQSFASKELKEEEVCCFSLEKFVQEFGCCLQNCARMVAFCIFACINKKEERVIYSNPRRAINPYIITPFRLRLVPHFSSGIVERAKRVRAWKSPHARKGDTRRVAFSRVGWFSRSLAFRSLYYPWEKMGDYS